MTVETIADIDVQLVSARWRWLHSVWDEKADGVTRAQADVDRLLERRYVLMHATVGDTSQEATRSRALRHSALPCMTDVVSAVRPPADIHLSDDGLAPAADPPSTRTQ